MVWLCKTKLCRKCKITSHGYRKLYDIHKAEYVCADIAKNVEARFEYWIKDVDTSNYGLDRPLTKEKNKHVIGLVKHKLAGKVMK